ncbi:hypothetical protein COCNU_scaffold003947G000010 [Cocos nucifera]|nr:hypothetical protein [Cocos nucifera]
MPIQFISLPDIAVAALSSTLPNEVTTATPPEQGEVVEKKKKKAIQVECLWEALRREEEAFAGLKAALTLSEDKRKELEEEVNVESERAIEAFKSFKAMKDIKVSFAKETFLEEFEICIRRAAKNFQNVDLNLLTDKPSNEAGPSNASATSLTAQPTPKTSEPLP